jgi:hypothetical protein
MSYIYSIRVVTFPMRDILFLPVPCFCFGVLQLYDLHIGAERSKIEFFDAVWFFYHDVVLAVISGGGRTSSTRFFRSVYAMCTSLLDTSIECRV